MAEAQKGIQATLFDYFQDTEYFTLQEAEEHVLDHQKLDVNVPSIRARIYEGIEKGLFERVGKGLYTVTRTDEQGRENKCLLINGDGRDLSFIPDNSIDALITDHPYQLTSSLKGGNRNFADYDLFQYGEQDFKEKLRVLKPGHFLVEFLPEENGDNYEYLYRVKDLARKAGFEYYARVPWKKGDFVANTGRKSKNTEDICFFSKGRARDLRPDAKKDKAEPGVEHFMSGAAGMLPTVFDVTPTSKKDKIHQAEKPVELLRQILRFVTKEDEIALDQFAGSGVLGEAALLEHRDSILIEKDLATYNTLRARIEALDNVKVTTEAQRETLHVAVDALEAVDDGPEATAALAAFHEQKGTSLVDVYQDMRDLAFSEGVSGEQSEVLQDACAALEEVYDAAQQVTQGVYQSIREWYTAEYPSDELGSKIRGLTFRDLVEGMNRGEDVYSLLGVGDSFVREHVFAELAKLLQVDYDMVYDKWLLRDNVPALSIRPEQQPVREDETLSDLRDKLTARIEALTNAPVATDAQKEAIQVAIGALKAAHDGVEVMESYAERQNSHGMRLSDAFHALSEIPVPHTDNALQDALKAASETIEAADLHKEMFSEKTAPEKKILECSSRGDNRFSALYAKVTINGKEQSIEEWYQNAKRTADGKRAGKGNYFDYITDPFTGDKLPADQASNLYKGLWITYLTKNPDLVEYAKGFDEFHDMFRGKNTVNCQADVIAAYVKDSDSFVGEVSQTTWYRNMVSKKEAAPEKKVLECSIRGDRRFSSLFAKVTINGRERSIEEWFQDAKRTADGKKAGKGKPFDHIVDPFTGDKLPGSEAQWMYRGLWITYFAKNPELVKYAEQFDEFTNCFNKYRDPEDAKDLPRGPGQFNLTRLESSVEEVIGAYVKGDRDRYVAVVKASNWYKNMARKREHSRKPALDAKIQDAHERQTEQDKPADQMSLFPRGGYNRGL